MPLLIGTGAVVLLIVLVGVLSSKDGAPSMRRSLVENSAERTHDSTEAAGIRGRLAMATGADLARLERLDHKWRFPHDSATHVRATTALLDSAERLLRMTSTPQLADAAAVTLNQIEQPLTSKQTERREQLRTRAQTRAREAARAAELAAANAADAQKWMYSVTDDPMTGRTSRMARIESENTVEFGFPYQGAQHGTLIIRNHPSFGRDIMLQIERGQILCPSYDDCTVRVRFDEGSPERWTGAGASDNSSTTVFLRGSSRFLQRMRAAKVVRISVPVYQEGQRAFEFRVGGFDNQRYTTGS
jgi:hypothetical protein